MNSTFKFSRENKTSGIFCPPSIKIINYKTMDIATQNKSQKANMKFK